MTADADSDSIPDEKDLPELTDIEKEFLASKTLDLQRPSCVHYKGRCIMPDDGARCVLRETCPVDTSSDSTDGSSP